jgi:hypothetical protein
VPLKEIHGHFFLVSVLAEFHLFELAHAVLEPLIIEEMGFNGLEK